MPPVYRGPFRKEQAERLLWRAGYGPRPGEAERLAKLGLHGAVHSLTRPGRDRLKGPRPHDDRGRPLAPRDRWGHDQLWWLDRMVRTTKPLHERMTLVWHDWFATSRDGVDSTRLMLRQNQLFRRNGLGSFLVLLLEVTKDPAMLLWLSGVDNEKDSPNENYARELMELFTLGADRGAYTERDVREQARALTGWRNSWGETLGPYKFRYDKRRHDDGQQAHLRQARPLRLARLVPPLRAPPPAPLVLREQALGLLHPGAAEDRDETVAERIYVRSGYKVAAGRRGDPAPPRALHRPAHGEAAGGLPRRPPARPRSRRRHRGLDVAPQPRGTAALLPAERGRLGRHALARHGHVPRPLGDRRLRDPAARAEGQREARARTTRTSCCTARRPFSATRP